MAQTSRKVAKGDYDVVFRFVEKPDSPNTIDEHSRIIQDQGAVWLGKAGRGLSADTITKLNNRAKAGEHARLYLTVRRGANYETHSARIVAASADTPSSSESKLIPKYYRDENLLNFVSLWFKLTDLKPVGAKEFGKLTVASSGLELEEALRKATANLFFVVR